ncbi:MAG: Rrf2 family transcriptional regulator [Nitrospirae bacterium]|nr:Rrf2 family transcriptional regulator [Nitrospirota bacterium]
MYEIAKGYPDTPVTIKVISERQDVSVPFLEQILGRLRKVGIIKSVKGPGGGYLLNDSPEKITIASILMSLEGPVAITSCLSPEVGCVKIETCVMHLLWKALGNQIEAFLNTITLNDLLTKSLLNDFLLLAEGGAARTEKEPERTALV